MTDQLPATPRSTQIVAAVLKSIAATQHETSAAYLNAARIGVENLETELIAAQARIAELERAAEKAQGERTRSLNLELDIQRVANGERAICSFEAVKRIEAALATSRAAALEEASRVCERRAQERFQEHGVTEWDTNASYYSGSRSEDYDLLDEEDEDCAAAIRALLNEGGTST